MERRDETKETFDGVQDEPGQDYIVTILITDIDNSKKYMFLVKINFQKSRKIILWYNSIFELLVYS